LAIKPNDVVFLTSKAFTLVELGKYNEAIEYWDKVLALDPTNAIALENKQSTIDKLG
jgi:tetratricopeptide (TPR) repeat protein